LLKIRPNPGGPNPIPVPASRIDLQVADAKRHAAEDMFDYPSLKTSWGLVDVAQAVEMT